MTRGLARRSLLGGLLPRLAFAHSPQPVILPQGQRLAALIDGMEVETHWIAKYRIDWRTGVAIGPRETAPGGHTHCSAFAAAVADRLGLYLLRPPEHGQDWLANAQSLWLDTEAGRSAGWRKAGRLAEPDAVLRAVEAANDGNLVLAAYFQPPIATPAGPQIRAGHVAIVRPSEKPVAQIETEGPDVAQAGRRNHRSVALRHGFADHPQGLADGSIAFFAHVTRFG